MAESASEQDEANLIQNRQDELILPARDFPLWYRKYKFSF